jgi:transposase
MGASRRGEREPGKSDQIDALAIARAVVKDGVDRFPAAYLDERALEIRLLADHREDLVRERTRVQNRLRWHLLTSVPSSRARSSPARLSKHASSTESSGDCGGCPPALASGSRANRSRRSAA